MLKPSQLKIDGNGLMALEEIYFSGYLHLWRMGIHLNCFVGNRRGQSYDLNGSRQLSVICRTGRAARVYNAKACSAFIKSYKA